ncbi:sugar transferase [Micromonospora chalcea]|uniref:sugar transferase n=1 Tax=Micromonospora TaxID=1873 RepID=UPI001F2B2E07|nr:sugar transferase [Micromonospora sp. LHW51205]
MEQHDMKGQLTDKRGGHAPLSHEVAALVGERHWKRDAKALRLYLRALVVLDTGVLALSILLAYVARFGSAVPPKTTVPYALFAPLLLLIWLLGLRSLGAYDDRVIGYGADEYRRVISAGGRIFASIALAAFFVDPGISRGFVILSFVIGTTGLVVSRFLARKKLQRARRLGAGWSRKVLVVGDTAQVMGLVHTFNREPHAGLQVVGACLPDALLAPGRQNLAGVPVIGSFRNIPGAAAAVGADTVAVTASGELTATRLRRLGWQLEGSGIDLMLAPALTDVAGPLVHTRPVAGMPLVYAETPELRGIHQFIKSMLDRSVSAIALILLLPLLAALVIAVKIDSPGPVIVRQVRVGRGGREFGLFKFRTMVVNADAVLAELAARNEEEGLLFSFRHDPRLTRMGRLLRKWSLDELPQLVNVLLGHMSLVGPRPPLPTEVARYDGDIARRLLVKPGMTGLWQVSGQSDLSWEDGIRLDLYYIENWSLTADLIILWKTFGAVVNSRSAY